MKESEKKNLLSVYDKIMFSIWSNGQK